MPIYEYKCTKCGSEFEVLQHVDDPHLTKCHTCGGRLEKKVSAPAIKFKGSGWYVNDYAKKTPNGNGSKSKHKPLTHKHDAAPKKDATPHKDAPPKKTDTAAVKN